MWTGTLIFELCTD